MKAASAMAREFVDVGEFSCLENSRESRSAPMITPEGPFLQWLLLCSGMTLVLSFCERHSQGRVNIYKQGTGEIQWDRWDVRIHP